MGNIKNQLELSRRQRRFQEILNQKKLALDIFFAFSYGLTYKGELVNYGANEKQFWWALIDVQNTKLGVSKTVLADFYVDRDAVPLRADPNDMQNYLSKNWEMAKNYFNEQKVVLSGGERVNPVKWGEITDIPVLSEHSNSPEEDGMKSQELRIGNWVRIGNETRQWSASDFWLLDRSGVSINDADISPIPLSKEWLSKFGATVGKIGFKIPLPNNHPFVLIIDKITLCVEIDNSNQSLAHESYPLFDWVKYVHQLQNLYFCLTGEELTIKG